MHQPNMFEMNEWNLNQGKCQGLAYILIKTFESLIIYRQIHLCRGRCGEEIHFPSLMFPCRGSSVTLIFPHAPPLHVYWVWLILLTILSSASYWISFLLGEAARCLLLLSPFMHYVSSRPLLSSSEGDCVGIFLIRGWSTGKVSGPVI